MTGKRFVSGCAACLLCTRCSTRCSRNIPVFQLALATTVRRFGRAFDREGFMIDPHDGAECSAISVATDGWMRDERGHEEGNFSFYLRVTRRDGITFGLGVTSIERVAELIDTLRPAAVYMHVGRGEDEAALLAQICLRSHRRRTGNVAARMGEACHQAGAYRVAGVRHDDRYRARRLSCGRRRGRGDCDDDVRLALDDLMRELGKSLRVAIRVPFLDLDSLAFHIAELGQPISEQRGDRRSGGGCGRATVRGAEDQQGHAHPCPRANGLLLAARQCGCWHGLLCVRCLLWRFRAATTHKN